MMDNLDKLPSDLTFQPDGHLSDIALTAIADGETEIVAESAIAHLDHCDHCTTRLGAEALLTAYAGELVEEVQLHAFVASQSEQLIPNAKPVAAQVNKEAATPITRAPLPKGALGAAIVIAAIGAAPSLIDGAMRLPDLLRSASTALVLLIRSANLIFHSDAGTTLAWVSSFLLLISGLAVSRLARTRTTQGLAEEGGF